METPPVKAPHDLKFAFSDFTQMIKRHKFLVIFAVLLSAIGCFTLAVTRPVAYLVQGSFRDKAKMQAGIRSSLTDFLFSQNQAQDSEAASTMKSKNLISEVISKLNAQGSITKIEERRPEIENAQDNLLAEWAYWANARTPILPDLAKPLALKNIQYKGELPVTHILQFTDQNQYEVFDTAGQKVSNGVLGQTFQSPDVQYTVLSNTTAAANDRYVVSISPLSDVAKIYANLLVIDVDHEDKTLLKLQFRHRDRHFAANFLNTLMDTYQKRLVDEHEVTAATQLTYLQKRQNEVGSQLEKLMQDHVVRVSDDMAKSGYSSLSSEMEFLASNLASNQLKLTEIDLERKRLKAIDPEACVHYDSYAGRGDPAAINHLLNEIRSLKQQSDTLELAIQEASEYKPADSKLVLEKNFHEFEKVKSCMQEADALHKALLAGNKEGQTIRALDTHDYPVSTWLATYKLKERTAELATPANKELIQKDLQDFKGQFLAYLSTFERLLKIQAATLEQRMRNQQTAPEEFGGISLDTSRALYLSYLNELNELQAQEKQHRFVIEQLKNEDFEISSLTALLHDPISNERISKATQLLITMKDENNRTQKERDRLKEELDLQKTFLGAHIKQIADLLALKADLLLDKKTELQGISLNLTHQQITLLRKQVADYVGSRLKNLDQETALIEGLQADLHKRLAAIPPKWTSEQLLNTNLTMHQRFLENLANMVESKNITKNLEMVQSAALDTANAPLNPKPPRAVFFTLFGVILGFLGASCFLFTRTMIRGIPASRDNLRLANFHYSGAITKFQGDEVSATTPLLDSDLDTMRRLIAHFEQGACDRKSAKTILLCLGNGPDFSNTLAKLLAKKGQRTLKIVLGFNREPKPESLPGLLQYLENKAEKPVIESFDGFDRISSGGISRYSEELLLSPRFLRLLDSLETSYDWIIGVSPVKIPSAEGENLAKIFDGTAIVVTTESLQELIAFSDTLDEQHKNALSFVFAQK